MSRHRARQGGNEGLDSKAYRQARRALRSLRRPCHICGHPIDYTLAAPDPMSFSADHLVPRSLGGALLGPMDAAHLSCNSRRRNRVGTPRPIAAPVTTHRW